MVELVDSPLSDELTASGQEERQPAVKAVDSPLSNEPGSPVSRRLDTLSAQVYERYN